MHVRAALRNGLTPDEIKEILLQSAIYCGVPAANRRSRSRAGDRGRAAGVKTQVGIVGAGPAGLTLALLLEQAGIDAVILEARPRAYVEQRVRAGVLEPNTVDLLRRIGAARRLEREGLVHDGIYLRRKGRTIHVPMSDLTGRHLTIYGQQEVVKDLIALWLERGGRLEFEVAGTRRARPRLDRNVRPSRWEGGGSSATSSPAATASTASAGRRSPRACSQSTSSSTHSAGWGSSLMPRRRRTSSSTPGMRTASRCYSMRSPSVSRLYLQVPADEDVDEWPDERIWTELQTRLGTDGWNVGEGEIFEKGITRMRSFVAEPMQHGRLFLAGDAAHIVPPTGAKGLNLAVNDVRCSPTPWSRTMNGSDDQLLQAYTAATRSVASGARRTSPTT